ncbi:probable Sporulation protein RMD8 [Zygosaccharomyces bailii]|nr:probable Sporulation protein RMD8 [Zygosaccharomyces bailii]
MSYKMANRQKPGRQNVAFPMSKRSPSILVTDSRSSGKRMSAPFAGHAAGLRNRDEHLADNSKSASSSPGSKGSVRRKPSGRFSEVSIENILSDASDVPSGRREERRSGSSLERFPSSDRLRPLSYANMMNPLPSRTSKTSQKLVLIPEEGDGRESALMSLGPRRSTIKANGKRSSSRRGSKFSRITAYNVAEGFNLEILADFLKTTHEVSPRMYDECLYVAYTLPLLLGKDGFRVRSNVSKRVVGGKTLIDKLIDNSEQRDHHYEYYSGVETVENTKSNYELESNGHFDAQALSDHLSSTLGNQDTFDPSEPQFFAEETPVEQERRERREQLKFDSNPKTDPTENDSDQHAEIFIFRYGVIVFWNFTEMQEKNILGDIAFADCKNLVIRPLDEHDIEREQFHFDYDKDIERPRIFNDIVTLRSGDHIIELTLSHAIAQSSKLSRFESRITPILASVTKLPKRLALFGTLGMKREQLLKKSGKLFKLRVDVNLSSSILDTPEFFWSFEPSLHPLYIAMREYLEIDQRVQVLNDRGKVYLEFFDVCVDSVAERNMARVTWWFIFVIVLGVLFSVTEILVRYVMIRNRLSV